MYAAIVYGIHSQCKANIQQFEILLQILIKQIIFYLFHYSTITELFILKQSENNNINKIIK